MDQTRKEPEPVEDLPALPAGAPEEVKGGAKTETARQVSIVQDMGATPTSGGGGYALTHDVRPSSV